MTEFVQPGSARYPAGLNDLEVPPPIHVLGPLREVPSVAVVGTRRCTRYGLDIATTFGAAIAGTGWAVVSGLARGIDAAAHRGCIETGGYAIAVMGCGPDVCYPRENRDLYDDILDQNGAVISEYPPGTPPDRWRFPARNRLIAAISRAVIVVEAGVTGGALITARLAAELGRPVFAVPGDVDREASKGCNLLIRDGAFPVLGTRDLLEELGLAVGLPAQAMKAPGAVPESGSTVEDDHAVALAAVESVSTVCA